MKVLNYEIRPYSDLRNADLSCANLRGANLRCAYLRGANLRSTGLRKCLQEMYHE